ncbi:MAG: Periplasmic thiol:disulfide interchange protein DsbA [Parcubacteria group bacterium GW2011_GWD2_42_14]|nr:MAG: Periplasmic thiol:disulfide interchange protein DsbA [Parcubacteria group bacterium GW2011_GWD2_42_14]
MFTRSHKPIFVAIVISLSVVGFTYWYTHRDLGENASEENGTANIAVNDLPGMSADDHVLGNPSAPMVFIVYSDFACPFCKEYHETLRTLMRVFGPSGKIAIVFRHMPFVQLHPEAPMYALASECIADEVGNSGFWKFADELFTVSDPLKPLTAAELVVLAEKAGATRQTFVACMRSNELMDRIEQQFNEVISVGVKGSPFTLVDDEHGRYSYEGAQTFRSMAESIQTTLRIMSIDELEPPSASQKSFVADFDALSEVATSSASTTTATSTSTVTPSSQRTTPLFQ